MGEEDGHLLHVLLVNYLSLKFTAIENTMNIFSVMMLNTLPFLLFFLQLDFATSEENIYVDYESNPDHPFPVLRWGKSALHLFALL